MKHILIAIVALGLTAASNAQLYWDGSPLPSAPPGGSSGVDNYFNDWGGGDSEFDSDVGIEFSLRDTTTKPHGITEANGWVDASSFAVNLVEGDSMFVTYLGKTAGHLNDFGINLGVIQYTLWTSIGITPPAGGAPAVGDQYQFFAGSDLQLDFWLNSDHPENGGTYSVFGTFPSDPDESGFPNFDYSARGKLFNVNDSQRGDRTILVLAIEDWRNFDADFTDMFFAIEIYDRDGNSQFPVPEPSTYGLIGAMMLLGLAAVRRSRRS